MSAASVLVLFALYAAVLDLGWGVGFIGAVVSPVGLVLLVGAGLLLGVRAVRVTRAPGPRSLRAARALLAGGGALVLVASPASLLLRNGGALTAGEGQEIGPDQLPGLPPLRFGRVAVAPHGPHFLSKTVSIDVEAPGEPPISIGLFPPTPLAGWRFSVMRYGYAPGIVWLGPDGGRLAEGFVHLGILPHREEDAALVRWAPEANVMMGAGTFPPKLEELVSPEGTGAHLFLRLDEATIAGARRDLRDPDAYRWLADGRLERAVFFVQAFRGKEKVFEGRVRAGEAVRFPGGALEISPEVRLWVELIATRDPFLPWVGAGLALLAFGVVLRAGLAAAGVARRAARALHQR